MKKTNVHFLCDLLRNELQCKGNRKCDISLDEKVLLSLNTLGSGSFQNSVKDKLNVSQPTISKYLTEFTEALCFRAPNFIYMPKTARDCQIMKQIFFR